MTSIVQINVSQTLAPTPSTLQGTGALITQGGTTLASGTTSLLTSAASLTALLAAALSVTGITQSAGTATATTAAPHGITTSDTFYTTVAGANQAAYNGTFLATATGASTFTYAVPSGTTSPATGTITYTPRGVAELMQMVTTFFAQGSQLGVYVLELGAGEPSSGVTALTTFIAAHSAPQLFYSYLVPRSWDGVTSFLTLLASYEAASAKTYFFVTTTTGTYTDYTAVMKCVFAMVESPSANPAGAAAEFSCAAPFWVTLNYSPSSTNKVSPTCFSYLLGVTAYPTAGNATTLASLQAAGVNVVGTGAEGGISNTILLYGTTMDLNDFTYWYSVDWVQINEDLSVSNAVINGSNNPQNPLYYNQDGINRLQAVAASVMNTGVADGLVLGQVFQTTLDPTTFATNLGLGLYNGLTVVNAIPFIVYNALNPSDFKIGKYAGLSVAYTPNRGFKTIVFNINVTQFVAP